MFQVVVLIATYLGSLLIVALGSRKYISFLLPFAVVYQLVVAATVGGAGTGGFHFLFISFGFVMVMIACNGFQRIDRQGNSLWRWFLALYAYMIVVACFGYYPLTGVVNYLQTLLASYCMGYFLASWACRTEGAFRRILFFVVIGSILVIYFNFLHGGFSRDVLLSAGGRATVDVESLGEGRSANVNYTALVLDMFVPFLLLAILMPVLEAKHRWLRWLAIGCFMAMFLLLVRTGSRNGMLVVVPCVLYFLMSGKGSGRIVRIFGLGLLALILLIVVRAAMKGVDNIRAFDFVSEEQMAGYAYNRLDAITSGRWSHYERLISKMDDVEKWFGKGFSLEKQEWFFDKRSGEYIKILRPVSQNYHSMYVTFFIRSGYIGCTLLLVFFCVAVKRGKKYGPRGRMGLMLIAVWALSGLGEAIPIHGLTAILCGFGIGLLRDRGVTNSELMGPYDYYQQRLRFRY